MACPGGNPSRLNPGVFVGGQLPPYTGFVGVQPHPHDAFVDAGPHPHDTFVDAVPYPPDTFVGTVARRRLRPHVVLSGPHVGLATGIKRDGFPACHAGRGMGGWHAATSGQQCLVWVRSAPLQYAHSTSTSQQGLARF
ncbi:hypothetical protein B0H19DRAFT_1256929 [Mycena capillaripes]|nr:hypothetical protein B0H19DRAFT_1256929 [Mycena capillaripes]